MPRCRPPCPRSGGDRWAHRGSPPPPPARSRPAPSGDRAAALERGLPAGFAGLERAAGNRAVGQFLRAPSIRVVLHEIGIHAGRIAQGLPDTHDETSAVISELVDQIGAFFRATAAGGALEQSPLTKDILAFVAANR